MSKRNPELPHVGMCQLMPQIGWININRGIQTSPYYEFLVRKHRTMLEGIMLHRVMFGNLRVRYDYTAPVLFPRDIYFAIRQPSVGGHSHERQS